MKVIILDAESRSALTALRSLTDHGISVIAASHKKSAISFSSRYCTEKFIYPSPTKGYQPFLNQLREFRNSIAEPVLIMSFSDVTSDALQFGKRDHVFADEVFGPSFKDYSRATDKRALGALAQSLNIPTPRVYAMDESGLPRESEQIEFPLIIKPARSVSWSNNGAYKDTARLAKNADEMHQYYTDLASKSQYTPLVQSALSGDEYGVSVLAHHGTIVAIFAHKRLRSITPHGGVSALRESVSVTPEMLSIAEKLTRELNWHGVMMVELKKDTASQALTLIEINARFWGSLYLAVRAGVDFPYLLYELATGKNINLSLNEYRTGIRARHIPSDISHFYALRKKALYPRNLIEFFTFFQKDMYYDVWQLSDPIPGILELYYFIKQKL